MDTDFLGKGRITSDKLEQTMKKIHIYLANCKESEYSSEELIVSKKRLFALLEELNYAVYEAREEYELTVSARERGIAMAERTASDIKHEAVIRAEEIHASSLLYTQEAISDIKSLMEYMREKVRVEYEMLLMNFEERMNFLERDSMEILSQLHVKSDAKVYLRLLEEIKEKQRFMERELELGQQSEQPPEPQPEQAQVSEPLEKNKEELNKVDSKEHTQVPQVQEEVPTPSAASFVVQVNDSPKVPEGFTNKNKIRGAFRNFSLGNKKK